MNEVRVRYAGTNHPGMAVDLLHTWKRNDWEIKKGYVMSTSSGQKDCTVNNIISLFDGDRAIDAVSYLLSARANGKNAVPFLIIRRGQQYFDVTGKEVEVIVKREAVPA